MPIQIGNSDSSTGWSPLADLRVGGEQINQVVVPQGDSQIELWRRNPEFWGPFTSDIEVFAPTWAMYADIVLLGAGGGGAGGEPFAYGNGGMAGKWSSTVWAMAPGRGLQIDVGGGGAGGPVGNGYPGGNGGQTKVTAADRDWSVTAAGGAGAGTAAAGNPRLGEAAGSYQVTTTSATWNLSGGGSAERNVDGKSPGGGGGGGTSGPNRTAGRKGGNGAVWIRFRSY